METKFDSLWLASQDTTKVAVLRSIRLIDDEGNPRALFDCEAGYPRLIFIGKNQITGKMKGDKRCRKHKIQKSQRC